MTANRLINVSASSTVIVGDTFDSCSWLAWREGLVSRGPAESARFSPRKLIFRTVDIVLDESDLHYCIGQVARANMLQGCGKKFALLQWDDVRHDDDYTRMERFFAVETKKVGAIVGDERVLLLADDPHKLPIFQSAESAVTDMVRAVARRMSDGNKGCVQALVNQQLHVGVATFRRWRVVRTAFRFAQGRAAGRPRRGKACTYRGASSIFSRSSAG